MLDDLYISIAQVEKLLKKCPDTNSASFDNLPSFFLRMNAEILAPYVFTLIQTIITSKSWPHFWKVAYVTPLHKNFSKSLIENYRPISILAPLSLVFERILYEYIYLKVRYIYPKLRCNLSIHQHGFMSRRSVITLLLAFTDKLYDYFDVNASFHSISFDLVKACDHVPNSEIMDSLITFVFDIKFLSLTKIYLMDRSQCVKLNNSLSMPLLANSGVPQGSVLGSLLFLLFINSLIEADTSSFKFAFADDLILSNTDEHSLQSDINTFYNWSTAKRMDFGSNKCLYFTMGDVHSHFYLHDSILQNVEQINFLGVQFTKDLNWGPHQKQKF